MYRNILMRELAEYEKLSDNSQIIDVINDILDDKAFSTRNELLPPVTTRKLNNFELSEFNIQINEYCDDVKSSLRLAYNNNVFHSREYSKVGQFKGSYFISYQHGSGFNFGEISYFLEVDGLIYVAIREFHKVSNCFFNDVRVRLPVMLEKFKNDGYFENLFFICEPTEQFYLINADDIRHKCLLYEKSENLYYVSEFFIETEHD